MGRGSTSTVGEGAWPKITTVAPWDGKDGEVGVMDRWWENYWFTTTTYDCYFCFLRQWCASAHQHITLEKVVKIFIFIYYLFFNDHTLRPIHNKYFG